MRTKIILNVFMVAMLFSSAALAEWSRVESSPSSNFIDVYDHNGTIYLAGSAHGVYRSDDSMQTFEPISSGLDTATARDVYQITSLGDTLFIATYDGIYKSIDGGDNWVRSTEGIFIGEGTLYVSTMSVYNDNGILYAGSYAGIFRSTDNGVSWQVTNIEGRGIWVNGFTRHDDILLASRFTFNFPSGYYSVDNGVTWAPLESLPFPAITFFSESGKLWAGTIQGVWLSEDDGQSWEDRSDGFMADPYNSSIIRVNGNLVATINGPSVFRSDNDGVLWSEFAEGFSDLSELDKLIVYDDKILAITSSGVWQRDTLEIPTAVDDDKEPLPETMNLLQNYPNPFNATTTISYQLPEESDVTIDIYNLLGRRVTSLVNSVQPAGEHKVTWYAGERASGMYYYRLRAGEINQARKMMLLK
jgi:photosystem II stability/assembly factor-like uncharacterized protein